MELEEGEEKGDTVKIKEEKREPQGGLKMKIFFIIFGIGSLLAWNAILSDIGFFIHYQGRYDPSTSFAFFNYALNIVLQFIMIWKKQILSYKIQLTFGLIASIINLIILPIVVTSFGKNSEIGFGLTAAIILFQGLVNAVCSIGFYGLTSFFPLEIIISLSTGQGISGILMNIIGYTVLASVDTGDNDKDNKFGAIIFFSISGLILLLSLIILFFAFQTDYFKYYLSKTKDFNKSEEEKNIFRERIMEKSKGEYDINEILLEEKHNKEDIIENNNNNDNDLNFFGLFKLLYDIDLLSCYMYMVTFALFPGVSISQRLFDLKKYRTITIISIYNIFGTVGRYSISKIRPTKSLAYIIILGRSILLFTLLFNFYGDQKLNFDDKGLSSIFLIINVSLLAVTNGIGTSLCFALAPSLVEDKYKGRAGGSVGFFNIVGIFLGTCIAFGTKSIMKSIGEYKDDEEN